MDQWDRDKYLELSKILVCFLHLTNQAMQVIFYLTTTKQALMIISDYTQDIEALKATIPSLIEEDFVKWWQEELDYLKNLQVEPKYDTQVVAYVEALEALAKAA